MDASFFYEGTLVGGYHLGESWHKSVSQDLREHFCHTVD
jgi:hypothetical protein